MSLPNDLHSIPRLFGDAIDQLGKLVHNEVQLARAELSQKLAQAGVGVALIAASAIFLIPSLVLVLIALSIGLIRLGMSPIAAYLIAGGAGGLVSLVLALIGLSYLKVQSLMPTVTVGQLQRDMDTIKELVK